MSDGEEEEDADLGMTVADDMGGPAAAKHWTKYKDPKTDKLFWVTDDESEHFFEESGEWKCYVATGGLLWWSKVGNDALWFYVHTGTASAM